LPYEGEQQDAKWGMPRAEQLSIILQPYRCYEALHHPFAWTEPNVETPF
jgi:hypothetical protein